MLGILSVGISFFSLQQGKIGRSVMEEECTERAKSSSPVPPVYHAHPRCAGTVTGDAVGEKQKATTCRFLGIPTRTSGSWDILQHIRERDSEAM